ncbi:MAG TPA: CBS domain-containing protein [Holophagaceae bacterium]|nr:CBS domain-containing protein [Holophagaceae bacterium]
MIVRDLCNRTPVSCREDANLSEVAGLMWEHDCGLIPVLEETGKVVGVISDRDICMALGTRDVRASSLRAREVMSTPIHAVHPEDSLSLAMRYMRQYQVRRLPVVDGLGRLLGLLSLNDLILEAQEDLPGSPSLLVYGEVMQTLKAIGTHPVAWMESEATLAHA